MNAAQHTPTPWSVEEEDGDQIISTGGPDADIVTIIRYGEQRGYEDATFIVRACNSHDALVAALKAVRADLRSFCGVVGRSHGVHSERACATDKRYRDVCAALAAAGEGA